MRTNKASSDFNRSTKLKLYERSNSVNEPPIIKEIVNDRYIVQRLLEKGDFGHVVLVVDETERNEYMIIKINWLICSSIEKSIIKIGKR